MLNEPSALKVDRWKTNYHLPMKEMVAKVLNFCSHLSKSWIKRFGGPKFQNLKGEHAYGVSRTSDVARSVYTVDI